MTPAARIVGLDVARALALFGMFASHIGDSGTYDGLGWEWLKIAEGRSSALFAVLAGVSMALMLTRDRAIPPRERIRHTRVRITTRAIILVVLGWGLSMLATPVDVILDNLGVMMLLALVALRWRPWVMGAVGTAVMVVGFWLVPAIRDALPPAISDLPLVQELWSIHYPALSWVGYVLVGMAVGRWSPWRGPRLAVLAGAGVAVAGLAYGAGLALSSQGVTWASVAPHSYTPFEMLGNTGAAAVVIAACCAAANVAPRALARYVLGPLAATGTMTLTLYSAHIVVIAAVGPEIVYDPTNVAFVVLCAASIAFAVLWKWRVGQGPMERLLTWGAGIAADQDARRRAAHA